MKLKKQLVLWNNCSFLHIIHGGCIRVNNSDIYSQIDQRRKIPQDQKVWKYIRDVNGISLNNFNTVAICDGDRRYTYGQMFREWERYASVFSALGMTGEGGSRVGILGATGAEALFAVYGLNMTGAAVSIIPTYSAFFPSKIMETVRSEKLTDFIVTDDCAQANLINEFMLHRNELGINNIIILHMTVAGATVHPAVTAAQEMKYLQIKSCYGPICMDELLKAYGNCPVSYASGNSDPSAFIVHTSGTTGGAGKPVVLSDKAFNAAVASFYEMKELNLPLNNLVTAVIVDLSNAYGIVDQVHLPFAMGASVVMVPMGVLNPWFYKAIPYYRVSFLFTISAMFERWIKMPERKELDFSGLKFVAIGGSAVSAADKKRYSEFLKEHGGDDVTILNGYGVSELAGACCLSSPDIDDESIGYPLPGVNVRLYDEESESFIPADQRPAEGVMYLNSTFVATTVLDGKEILKAEYLNDAPYICTNDIVRIEKDDRIVFLGRANRYFINEEGRKYESGRVETEIARQEGIGSCCVVPVYVKTTHDNMPMLCIQPLTTEEKPQETVIKALKQVFVVERTLPEDYIPFRVMITEELPRNGNGKTDLYKIGRGEVEGEIFTVETVKVLKHIKGFKLKPYKDGPADMIKEVFDDISKEMKSNLHFNKNNNNDERWDSSNMNSMNSVKKAFESFNSMNRMGMQMMNNMMGKMGNMQCGMSGFKNMMQGAQNMMPGFKNMMQGFGENAGNMTNNMGPVMQQQMGLMMENMMEMNQIAMDTMQKMYDQQCKMMNQFFTSMQTMSDSMDISKPEDGRKEKEDKEDDGETASPAQEPVSEPEKKEKPVKASTARKRSTGTAAKKQVKKSETK